MASISYWASGGVAGAYGAWTTQAQTIRNTVGVATLTVSGQLTHPRRALRRHTGRREWRSRRNPETRQGWAEYISLNGNTNSYVGGTTVENGLLLSPSTTDSTGYAVGNGDVTLTGGTLQGIATLQGNLIVGSWAVRAQFTRVCPTRWPSEGNRARWPLTIMRRLIPERACSSIWRTTSSNSLLTIVGGLTLPNSGSGSVTVNVTDPGLTVGNKFQLVTFGSLAAGSTSTLVLGTPTGSARTWAGITRGQLSDPGLEIDLKVASSQGLGCQ